MWEDNKIKKINNINQLNHNNYLKFILVIAIPIAIQSLLQSSFSVVDQIMIGQLGEDVISSIYLSSKIPSIFYFTISSITVGSSILISQYIGQKNKEDTSRAFWVTFKWGFIITIIFSLLSFGLSEQLLSLFTKNNIIIDTGSKYLKIISLGYIPVFISGMIGTLLRNTGKAKLQLIATIVSICINTLLNGLLIFGPGIFPKLGASGAAIATTISRYVSLIMMIYFFIKHQTNDEFKIIRITDKNRIFNKKVFIIIAPVFLSELAWSTGEAVYGIIYGHMSINEASAMSLIGPIISLSVGLFVGISQAAGILVGKELGNKKYDLALFLGKKSLKIGIIGTLILGVIVIAISPFYPNIYSVTQTTKNSTSMLLITLAFVLWIKVANMILSGILKSGGKTLYVLMLDVIGTWGIGIPLGFLAAFVFHFPIGLVYLFISIEELVKLIIGYKLFKSKKWIETI